LVQHFAVSMATLKGLEKEVEAGGRKYAVKIADGEAEVVKSRGGRFLLRIKIAAEVDGVRGEYTITFSRRGKAAVGRAYAKAGEDAERLVAVVKALTDKEPRVRRMKSGRVAVECGLADFARYKELTKYVMVWIIVV